MRRDSRKLQVRDAFRAHFERFGRAPTCQQLGDAVGMSAVGAWKHVQTLIKDGVLIRTGKRGELPRCVDLTCIPTELLRDELARRGITMDALEEPKLLFNEGRPCAANFCEERVPRGRLMCRKHWFELPHHMRSAIMNAWSAQQMGPYGEAVEAARDYLGGFTKVVERVE